MFLEPSIEPSSVFAMRINGHSSQWDGSICANPENWNCGARAEFRKENCAQQSRRCFHLSAFEKTGPKFLTPDISICQLVRDKPDFFNDQLLVLYGNRFAAIEPGTTGQASKDDEVVFGLYRIKSAYFEAGKTPLVIEPHPGEWAIFPRNAIAVPPKKSVVSRTYLKSIQSRALTGIVKEALAMQPHITANWTPQMLQRLQEFSASLTQWLKATSAANKTTYLDGTSIKGSLAEQLKRLSIKTVPHPEPEPQQAGEAAPTKVPTPIEPSLTLVSAPVSGDSPLDAPGADAPALGLELTATTARLEMPKVDAEVAEVDSPYISHPPLVNPPVVPVHLPKASAQSTKKDAKKIKVKQMKRPSKPLQTLISAAVENLGTKSRTWTADSLYATPSVTGLESATLTLAPVENEALTQPVTVAKVTEPEAELAHLQGLRATLPEPQCFTLIEQQYDARLAVDMRVAFGTKPLVILTGAPGAGKSWLASHILDDDTRDRSVIVPVASTWRGREDLLGYVNPINGLFEPTEFTEFLLKAQQAWESGDARPRLIIFEEFNLSQPEHWLSDLLVRMEYRRRSERTIALGGASIARHQGRPPSVYLTPSLSFVATLNNDHTVKPLSPRVLDRAALLEVSSSGHAALRRLGLTVDPEVAEAIGQINALLFTRGAAFSVRSALSLQRVHRAQAHASARRHLGARSSLARAAVGRRSTR